MKLYYAPNACSLADHVALLEAGQRIEVEAVDIKTKRTESGADFRTINPKGYVPAIVLDTGEILTENVACLDWIADRDPVLRPKGPLGRTRLIEMLTFISTEIHGAYKPLWHAGSEADKQTARERIAGLLAFAAKKMQGSFLFGDQLSAADCYLLVMLRWAERFSVEVPDALFSLKRTMEARPAVKEAIEREELNTLVRENPREKRFERPIHDDVIAAAYYRNQDGKLAFIHTETPAEFSGEGIASALAAGTFELLRATGRKAILVCPFMVSFYNRHPEYSDVVEA